MRCPDCGFTNSGTAKFCMECGARLAEATPPPLSAEATIGGAAVPAPPAGGDLSLQPTLGSRPTPAPTPAPPAANPTWLAGRYELLAEIGRGGMGVVHQAHDHKLGRPVALKRILAPDDQGVARFLREAQAIAALNHQNIRAIYDRGEDEQGPYLAMEWVEGETLHDRVVRDGALSTDTLLEVATGLARGLAYAHRRSVIHRDVKPANVLLGADGTPKLTDFGLARMGHDSDLSVTGYGMGTLDYASSEQRRDAKSADHRSDIYGLGATLYFAATGESPKTIRETRIPERWRAAVMKCLEEKPENRYFSVDDLLRDLESLRSRPLTPPPIVVGDHFACPSCQAPNPLKKRFCLSCGSGLFQKCPKCGGEERAGVRYCGACGVDIPAWQTASEHLQAAQRHYEGHAYGRAIKEAKAALEAVPGREDTAALLKKAEREGQTVEHHRTAAQAAAAAEEHQREEEAWRALLGVVPDDEEALRGLATLPDRARALAFRRACEETEGHLERRSWPAAAAALEQAAAQLPPGRGEARHADLEQRVADLREEILAAAEARFRGHVEAGAIAPARAVLAEMQELRPDEERAAWLRDWLDVERALHEGRLQDARDLLGMRLPNLDDTPAAAEENATVDRLRERLARMTRARAAARRKQRARRLALAGAIATIAVVSWTALAWGHNASQLAAAAAALEDGRYGEVAALLDSKWTGLGWSASRATLLGELAGSLQRLDQSDEMTLLGLEQSGGGAGWSRFLPRSWERVVTEARRRLGSVVPDAIWISATDEIHLGEGHPVARLRLDGTELRELRPRVFDATGLTSVASANIQLEDGAGVVAELHRRILVDREVPRVELLADPPNLRSGAPVGVELVASELLARVVDLEVTGGRGSARVNGSQVILELVGEAPPRGRAGKEVTWTFVAADLAGNPSDEVRGKALSQASDLFEARELLAEQKWTEATDLIPWELPANQVDAEYRGLGRELLDAVRPDRQSEWSVCDHAARARAMAEWMARVEAAEMLAAEERAALLAERPPVLTAVPRPREAGPFRSGGQVACELRADQSVTVLAGDGTTVAELESGSGLVSFDVPRTEAADPEPSSISFRVRDAEGDEDAGTVDVEVYAPRARQARHAAERPDRSSRWVEVGLEARPSAVEAWARQVREDALLLAAEKDALLEGDPSFRSWGEGVARDAREAREAREVREAAAKLNPFGWDVLDATPGPKTGAARRLRDPNTGVVFILVEPGGFLMGSPTSDNWRAHGETQHRVTLTKAFYLGETEVTQAQWQRVTGEKPSNFTGETLPVEQVSWADCQEFCRKAGAGYRLPTDAEWEYACRAGSATRFCFGDEEGKLGEYAWYSSNSGNRTHPVGQRRPNTWGFKDMHGNVSEWCQDRYGNDLPDPVVDPKGASSGSCVLRGGSWGNGPRLCRSANRRGFAPSDRLDYVGLRVARTL